MPRKFNTERAAIALVDALTLGDRAAAQKHNVSLKSIENWRARLESDPDLKKQFQLKQRAMHEAWIDEIPSALQAQLGFFKRMAQDGDPKDPETIRAVVEVLKVLTDIQFAKKLMDARLSELEQRHE